MATICGKEATVKEGKSIVKSANEYATNMQVQTDKTIKSCSNGDISRDQAKGSLAKQWADNPGGFKNAVQDLENKLGTGRNIVGQDVRMVPEGRVYFMIYGDNSVEGYLCHSNGQVDPVMPNPEFNPTVMGTSVRFADSWGQGNYRNAEGAAATNQGMEQSGIFTPTGGNCPQDARLVPDYVIDPTRRF